MVAVAHHHAGEVLVPPLGEIHMVVIFVLAGKPHVESLVHDQHAVPVAEVKELGAGDVVRSADRIASAGFEYLNPALPDPLGHCRAHCAGIMMQVDTLHLDLTAVEQETAVHVVLYGTDPYLGVDSVHNPAVKHNGRTESIEIGRDGIPEMRTGHFHPGDCGSFPGGEGDFVFHGRNLVPVCVEQLVAYHRGSMAGAVAQGGFDHQQRAAVRNAFGAHEHAPLVETQLVSGHQAHMAVDSGTGVPA